MSSILIVDLIIFIIVWSTQRTGWLCWDTDIFGCSIVFTLLLVIIVLSVSPKYCNQAASTVCRVLGRLPWDCIHTYPFSSPTSWRVRSLIEQSYYQRQFNRLRVLRALSSGNASTRSGFCYIYQLHSCCDQRGARKTLGPDASKAHATLSSCLRFLMCLSDSLY